MSQRIFESRARMPRESGPYDNKPTDKDSSPYPSYFGPRAAPQTVHSLMTPADCKTSRESNYGRYDWMDIQHVRKSGE